MTGSDETSIIYVVDDDPASSRSLCALLNAHGLATESFDSPQTFLSQPALRQVGCVITDFRMPNIDGLQLQETLLQRGVPLPVIVISGYASVPVTVQAMRRGAVTLLEKPLEVESLLTAVRLAIHRSHEHRRMSVRLHEIQSLLDRLSADETAVMVRMLQGKANKVIAMELNISTRTVDRRRHDILRMMKVATVPELTRLIVERDHLQAALHQPDSSDEIPVRTLK